MPSLLDLIKTAGSQAVDAGSPVNIMFGEVVNSNPLSVKVDQRFTLTADFLILPESLTPLEIDLKHTHQYLNESVSSTTSESLPQKIIIRSGLKSGDKVIMVRVQGGQQYVVLDKVVIEL